MPQTNRNFKNVYPSDVKLKKENILTSDASFLELSIIIGNKKFKTQLYDKRDASLFSFGCMPHLDSNIQENLSYASIGSETLRFARTTSNKNTFQLLMKMETFNKNEETRK